MTDIYLDAITFFLILVALPFVLKRISKKKIPEENGWRILKPPMEMLVLGLGGLLASSLVFFIDLKIPDDIIWVCFSVFFFLAGGWFVIWYYRCTLYFNDTRIKFYPTFGRPVDMNWSDVKSVGYNRLTDRIIISDSINKVGVDIQFLGYTSFLDFLKTKLPEQMYSEALKKDKKLRIRRGLE